jgi:hypothetical protein
VVAVLWASDVKGRGESNVRIFRDPRVRLSAAKGR